MQSSGEQWQELMHYVFLDIREDTLENGEQWLTDGNGVPLTELYLQGNLRICVHMRTRHPELREDCTVYRLPTSPGPNVDNSTRLHTVDLEGIVGDDGADDGYQAMLVGVRELMQQPEWMGLCLAPSLVRLQPLKQCAVYRRNTLENKVPTGGRVRIPLSVVKDGELSAVVGSADVQERNLPCEMVEGRSQVVKNIAQDGVHLQRQRISDFQAKGGDSGLRIVIHPRYVRVTGKVGTESGIELVNVLVRTIDLHEDAIEGVSHS